MPVARTNKQRHRVKTIRARKEKLRKRLEKAVDPKPEELKEMDTSIAIDDEKEWSKMTVTMPKGCKRDSLSLVALDRHTRNLAAQTHISVDGKNLPCLGFQLLDSGVLRVDVHPEAVEIIR